MRSVEVSEGASRQDLGPVLDEELRKLPERYRLPLLLCYWQGKTHQAAAAELACPVGTLSWRLAHARDLLRQRLRRRGVVLSTGLLAALLTEQVCAAVPSGLAAAAVTGALHFVSGSSVNVSATAALAREVLRAMTWMPRKAALTLLLTLGLATVGVGVFARREGGEQPAAPRQANDLGSVAKEPAQPAVDRFGDALPAGALVRFGTVRLHQGDVIKTVVWSPDGKLLASAGQDGSVRLWDVATGKELTELRGQTLGAIESVVFSPDGNLLASAHPQGDKIHLWDVATRRPLRELGHAVNAVAFAPDGKTLVSLGTAIGKDGLVRWDIATGQALQSGDTADPYAALLASSDGKLLATRHLQGQVHLWDAATCKFLRPLDQQEDQAEAFAFSPDGKVLATGNRDTTVRLWDPSTGKELRRLTGAGLGVVSVAFCDGGKTVIAGTLGGMLLSWDVEPGKERRRIQALTARAIRVAPSPDDKTLASWGDDCVIRLWDRATGKELRPVEGHESYVRQVAYSAAGKRLVTGGYDYSLRLWDAATGAEVRRLPDAQGAVSSIALSPDGRLLASATWQNIVQAWDTNSGKEQRPPDGEPRFGHCVAWSPDGKLLAAGGQDGMIRLWEAATGKERSRFSAHPNTWIFCLAFSPDGKTLASGAVGRRLDGEEITIRCWDVATGKPVRTFEGHRNGVVMVAYSPDGQFLASGSHDATLRVWDATTGKELRRFDGFHGTMESVAFSPDSKLLATGGDQFRTIHVWELATGKEVLQLKGHRGLVSSVTFAPGGRSLASGSQDGTALVWDLTGGPQRHRLSAAQGEALWADLANADAAVAYHAIWALAAAPREAVLSLREHLPPVPREESQGKRIARLIEDLDAEAFATRESASAALAKLGEAAQPALREALVGNLSLEARRRVERLLKNLEERELPAEVLRAVRAVTVLEQIATPEARALLRELAAGAPEARLTREAKAAVARLAPS